ncbi:putative ribonuclease H-like domain-containing protein [Tanacetum coccineum]
MRHALVKTKEIGKAERKKRKDELKLTLEKFQNSSKSLNNLLESQVIDKFKIGLGYNAASSTAASPAVESFVNSSEMLENQEIKLTLKNWLVKTCFRPPVIEDWNFDDDSEVDFIPNVENKIVGLVALKDKLGNPQQKEYKEKTELVMSGKDETSGILKTFITEIENQLDHKVKVIRYDNRTEFKNSVMNQFCEMKGIKREFSVARTPRQNGVAEMRNRTLIEAARTICCRKSTNGIVGTKDNIVTGQAEKKIELEQEYILIPICTTDPLISQDPKVSKEDAEEKPTEMDESGALDKDGEDDQATRSEFERLLQRNVIVIL